MTSALRGEGEGVYIQKHADIVSNISKGGCVNLKTGRVSKNPKILRSLY